ncbi:MAG TPA: proprotein convertase P-domain-containing protein, partial [Flavobacteriales bacterium]|nr:proprotein convertase P-domain-containing protein [Flavobacteriales bacterium]
VDDGCSTNAYTDVTFCVSSPGTALGTDVFVRSIDLIASHTYNQDLRFSLISPSGTTVSLVSNRFGSGDNLGNPASCPGSVFTLQDGAAALTNANTSNVTGTFAPEQALTTFHNGSNPNGVWTLRVCDNAGIDVGAIRYVHMNLCAAPYATITAVDDCANDQFTMQVNVTSLGSGANANLSYTVDGGNTINTTIGAGASTFGPFPSGSEILYTLSGGTNGCGAISGALYSNCPYTIPCGTTLSANHCYRNNDHRTFTFQSASAFETVTLTFIAGTMDPNDVIRAYDGTDNNGMPIPSLTGTFANLANVSGTSSGNSIFLEIESDGNNSCSTGQQSSWTIEARCTPGCVDPDGAVTVNTNCAAYNFTLDVDVFFTGDAATTTLRYTVNGSAPVDIPGLQDFDEVDLGPFAIDDVVNVRLLHENSASCDRNLGNFTDDNSCQGGESCLNALNLATQVSPLSGTTTGRTNDFSLACGTATANTARDAIYYIDVPNGAQLNIRQQSNNYNSQHYVRYGGACPGTTAIACVDDDNSEIGWVAWANTTGSAQRVWWIQDGFGTSTGNFVLEWQVVTCPVAPGPPTPGVSAYSICQNGTVPVGQGLSASCASVAQSGTSIFPGGGLISEGTTLTTRATLVMPTLPAGAVVTAARLKLNNIVANPGNNNHNAQRQNFRVALSGAYTLGETQVTAATGPGAVTPNPVVINLPGFPAAGGSINLRTRQTNDQSWTNPDVNIASAIIEVDYSTPLSVRWYNAPASGTLVFTGSQFNPVAQGAVNNSVAGTTNFYATCAFGSCENIRIPTSFTVVPVANAGTNGSLTICSNAATTSLFAQLGGAPQSDGSWSGPSPVSGGNYNPVTMNQGVYTYTVSGTAPCANASATVTVTENTATLWYADLDNDGFGDPNNATVTCSAPL